jgi:uroporphyrinogen decarboxylase
VYVERILPYVKRITAAVRKTNTPVIFFPKGIGAGISYINHEIADYAGIDWQYSLTDVRTMCDPKMGLQGNFDPRILAIDDQEILEKELEKFLSFGSKNHNWIFNTGHGLSPDNSVENVKFVVDWVKKADWKRS